MNGHAQEDSFIEADLADLVAPRFVPATPPSVYGGLSHSEYHESPPENTFSPPPASYYSSASHHSFHTNPATSPRDRLSSTHVPPHRSSLPPNPKPGSNELPTFERWSPTWVSGGYSGDGKAFTSHTPPRATYASSAAWTGPSGQQYPRSEYDTREEEEEEEREDGTGGWVPEPPFVGEWEAPGGTYLHGVGYESTVSLGALSSQKVADRLRRLEREFGGEKGAGGVKAGPDEPVTFKERLERARRDRKNEAGQREVEIGVDAKGRLAVHGPKKRAAARWLQGLLAFGVAFASIGASLLTHPTSTPPPDKKTPLYILYILPFLSLALTTHLLLLRPCLLRSASRKASPNHLILPLHPGGPSPRGSPPSGWCCCSGPRKQPQRWVEGGQSVNLVIDPSMFPQLLLGGQLQQATTPLTTESREAKEKRRRRRRRRAKVAEKRTAAAKGDDDDELLSSGEGSSCSSDTDSDEDNGPRQAMGAGGEKERAGWKAARKTVKVFAWWDIIAGLFWAAVGVWAIGFGERCTPGAFQGWCNFYNSALAVAVLAALAFFTSFAFDCLDLRRSKDAPDGHHHPHRLQAGIV